MKNPITVTFVAILMVLMLSPTVLQKVEAQEELITYIDLPADSLPMGIIYDEKGNSSVWVALHWNCSIAKIDTSTKQADIYPLPLDVGAGYYYPTPWTLTFGPDGNLWISIRSYKISPAHPPENIPYLAKMDVNTGDITILWIPKERGGGSDIKYSSGFVWYLTKYSLLKINYSTTETVENYTTGYSDGFMAIDENFIWFSSVSGNTVTKFNIETRGFDLTLNGFDRPLGIAIDSQYVYVAENSQDNTKTGTIVKLNKITGEVVERLSTAPITNEGPYMVYLDTYNNLWWTDNSYHIGMHSNTLDVDVAYESKPYNYFMVQVESSIWFSCVGSAHVGVVETPVGGPRKYGDVNGDDKVSGADIGKVKLVLSGYIKLPFIDQTTGKLLMPDVNGDGKVSGADIGKIKLIMSG